MVVPGGEPAAIGEWPKLSVNEYRLPFGDVFAVSSEKVMGEPVNGVGL